MKDWGSGSDMRLRTLLGLHFSAYPLRICNADLGAATHIDGVVGSMCNCYPLVGPMLDIVTLRSLRDLARDLLLAQC